MFVIINVGSERIYETNYRYGPAKYKTERGAKGACTRLNKQYGDTKQWEVVTFTEALNRQASRSVRVMRENAQI